MHETEEELWNRWEKVVEEPPSEAVVEELRELVYRAEAGDHRDLLISARLWLAQALVQWAPETDPEVLTAFTRCVALYTKEPERFDEDDLDLLWQGFGAIGISMIHRADRPVEQIYALLDDMRAHCRPERDDPHLIHLLRLMLDARVGDITSADAALHKLRSLDTPEYMNPGGTIVARAKYLALLERDEEAFAAVEPLLSGRVSHEDSEGVSTHPLNHLACLLPSCLRTGRMEQAREIHRRTWRQLDNDEDLAANLEFCARSGNEERGLRVLQRLIDDDEDLESSPEMLCTAAAALMARRMVDLGRGAETFSFQEPTSGTHPRVWTFAEFYAEGTKNAMDFARMMDERSGTTYQTRRVRALIHAEPIVDHLPLTPIAEARQRLAQASRPTKHAERPGREDSDQLLDAAERAWQLMAEVPEIRELLDRHDAVAPGPLDDLREARRSTLRAVTAERAQDCERGLRRAAELYRRLPDEAGAQYCLGLLGTRLCWEGRTEEGRPLMEDAITLLNAEGDRYQRARAAMWTADALNDSGDVDAALAAHARVHDTVAEDGDDPTRAALLRGVSLYDRARMLASAIEHGGTAYAMAEVSAYLQSAAEEFQAAGHHHGLAAAHLLRGWVALVTEEDQTRLDAYREATIAFPGSESAAIAHAMRGEILLHDGDTEAATVDLVEAVAAFSALGDRRANHARLDLANAYAHCERWLDAAECVEEVLPALDEREEDLPLATRMRWILAQAYHSGLDRPDEVIRVLDEMIELPGDDQQHAEAAALLAELQQDEGRGPA